MFYNFRIIQKTTPPTPRTEVNDKITRERLIDATIESVYQHGYADTTIAKISDLAEVSPATVHHYFDNKDGLLDHTMRRLLEVMHNKVVDGCAQADSPRGKLDAVVQSVLGDEQSDERSAQVWLSFWVHAEYSENLRRIRDLYSRRLHSNIRGYLRQILRETGAADVDERADHAAAAVIAMLHGAWLSHAIGESKKPQRAQPAAETPGLEPARQLVWDYLEMLLARAREPSPEGAGVVAVAADLMTDFSIEVTAGDMKIAKKWLPALPEGAHVFVPHFRGGPFTKNIQMTSDLVAAGVSPIPHLAARNIRDADELERMVAGLAGVGAREFLLLGGGENPPVGNFHSAVQLLQTGVFRRHNARRVGFAGHPESHPEQDDETMRRALLEKIAVARQTDSDFFIATQFCFAAAPFFDFLDWLKAEGVKAPVRLGLAGRVNAAKLLKFAAACGIGRSLKFLQKRFAAASHLVNYSPEGLLSEIAARIAVRQYDFPVGVHFYPFGAVRETLAVVSESGAEAEPAPVH